MATPGFAFPHCKLQRHGGKEGKERKREAGRKGERRKEKGEEGRKEKKEGSKEGGKRRKEERPWEAGGTRTFSA